MLCIGYESGLLRNGPKLLRNSCEATFGAMERWNSVVLCGFALSLRVCPAPSYSEMVRSYSEVDANYNLRSLLRLPVRTVFQFRRY